MCGICNPVAGGGEYTIGINAENNGKKLEIKSKFLFNFGRNYYNEESKIETPSTPKKQDYAKARQKINELVTPLFKKKASQQEVSKYIAQFNGDPEFQAWVISYIITNSAIGLGTNEEGFRAGIYGINKNNYDAVNKHLQQVKGMTISQQIDDEMSADEGKDLHRHINQFKKK